MPYTLDERARDSIRSKGIIQKAEQWMRENVAWDGFNDTNHLEFWRGMHPSQSKQWEGQPSRFGGMPGPLRRLRDVDWWTKVTFRQTLYDNLTMLPSAEELRDAGMYFNRFRALEFIDKIHHIQNPGFVAKWEHDSVKGSTKDRKKRTKEELHDVASRPYKPYVDPHGELLFGCFNSTSPTEQKMPFTPSHRSGITFHGPGVMLMFINMWIFDENGMPQVKRTTVSGEQWVSKEENRRLMILI